MLRGKGVYFVRTTPPGKPVSVNAANDNEILFGEISEHTVPSFDTLINQIFKPMIEKLEVSDWGACESEQKKEFTTVFDKFANELREARKSHLGNVHLENYPKKYENEVKLVLQQNKAPSHDMI